VVVVDEGEYNARKAVLHEALIERPVAQVRVPGTLASLAAVAALGGFVPPKRRTPKANVNKRCPICGTDVGKGRAGRKCKPCRKQTGD